MKSVVITGVGKGFGHELFFDLKKSYHVIGITRSENDIAELSDLAGSAENYSLIHADVTDFDRVSKCLTETLSNVPPLWGLINNAGIRFRKDFLDIEMREFDNVIQVNLLAPIYLSKLCIPFMLENKGGRIINISSILSKSALTQLSAYAVSKGGLDAFTRSLAVEFGEQNIRANSLLPGFCETSYFPNFKTRIDLYDMTLERTPAKCWGRPDELNGLCHLLLEDGGSYINGASIAVDGGWLA